MACRFRWRASAAAFTVAVVAVASACGGGSSDKASGPVATRPEGALPTGVGIPDPRTTTPPSDRRSQPYWLPVVVLSGTGDQRGAPFAIVDGALQWRASWKCEAGSLTAVGVKDGKELRKKLIDETCPKEGTAYSTQTGAIAIEVKASSPWTINIEAQVDVPLIESPPPGLEAAKLLASAQMYDIDHQGEGAAKIYQLADGSRILRLDDFFVTANVDLEIRFSDLAQPRSTDEVVAAMPQIRTLAMLKATVGDMNYEVPADLDLTRYHSIVIWCEITRNAYAAASIEPA